MNGTQAGPMLELSLPVKLERLRVSELLDEVLGMVPVEVERVESLPTFPLPAVALEPPAPSGGLEREACRAR